MHLFMLSIPLWASEQAARAAAVEVSDAMATELPLNTEL